MHFHGCIDIGPGDLIDFHGTQLLTTLRPQSRAPSNRSRWRLYAWAGILLSIAVFRGGTLGHNPESDGIAAIWRSCGTFQGETKLRWVTF